MRVHVHDEGLCPLSLLLAPAAVWEGVASWRRDGQAPDGGWRSHTALNFFERERESKRASGGGQTERISSRIHTQCGAPRGARSRDPEITT